MIYIYDKQGRCIGYMDGNREVLFTTPLQAGVL